MAKKTIPVNNYNDSDNYGTSGAAPSLYSDKHYLDGDGFLYGLGMASQRMIVKGKTADIDTNLFYWDGNGTSAKLGLNLLNLENTLQGVGLTVSAGKLNVNVGQGLYIGTQSSSSSTMNKININFFKKNVTIDGTASLYNTSGLELVTGTADDTGAPAAGQLRIKLSETGSGTSYVNTSGLVLKDPGDIGNLHVTEGLMVNYDNVTIGLNASNQLEVKASAIVPNISGTNPIEVTTSGNNKAIGLKLRPTADGVYSWSGLKVYDTADADGGIGLSIDINRTSHGDNPLDIDAGGLFIDWKRMLSNFASSSGGNLSYYTDGSGHFGISVVPGVGLKNNPQSKNLEVKPKPNSGIGADSNGVYLKVASTSEIGGVKTGTPATISGTNTVDIPLFLDSNNVGWVRTNVFTQKAPASGSAGEFPYSASYIDNNYSTKTEVTAEIATAISDISGREYKIFPTLPAKGESQSWADFYAAYKKYIALVSNTGTAPDAYKEYILIVTNESTGECHWEQIGDTEFTTDNFVAKTDVLTQAEVASIVQDVFGF